MAEQAGRRALGRGLAALLGDAPPPASAGLVEVAVDAIRPNPDQPRRRIDPEGLAALVASIRASGVVQPVVVRPDGEGYELVAGERRWRAAREAGLERIPAVVRDADERERLELGLVENLVREDLNAIEVARALAVLVEDFGQTQAALAERLGRSRSSVANLLRLLELPDDVQDLVVAGSLTEGHARAVLQASGAAARRRIAARAVEAGLSVRQTEALARQEGAPRSRATREASPLEHWAVDVFYGALGAAARAREASNGQVVVELRFSDRGTLDAALERLNGLAPIDPGE
ncbi:MAG: ParB/RepB/Spo0J family partition protein [Actinomycetota bacterium]